MDKYVDLLLNNDRRKFEYYQNMLEKTAEEIAAEKTESYISQEVLLQL